MPAEPGNICSCTLGMEKWIAGGYDLNLSGVGNLTQGYTISKLICSML